MDYGVGIWETLGGGLMGGGGVLVILRRPRQESLDRCTVE